MAAPGCHANRHSKCGTYFSLAASTTDSIRFLDRFLHLKRFFFLFLRRLSSIFETASTHFYNGFFRFRPYFPPLVLRVLHFCNGFQPVSTTSWLPPTSTSTHMVPLPPSAASSGFYNVFYPFLWRLRKRAGRFCDS